MELSFSMILAVRLDALVLFDGQPAVRCFLINTPCAFTGDVHNLHIIVLELQPEIATQINRTPLNVLLNGADDSSRTILANSDYSVGAT